MIKKISWITPECFLDVDLPIINELKRKWNIYWQIILPYNATVDNEDYVNKLMYDKNNISIEYVKQKHRMRDLRTLLQYIRVINNAKLYKPDVYYISNYQMPYGIILYKLLLPLDKVVAACHNVSTPKGAANAGFADKYTRWWLKTFKNIQVFSKSQKRVLDDRVKGKNILMTPLALKDYGMPTKDAQKDDTTIRFLNFGVIQTYKRVDLLIKAANLLVERGYRNFRVKIAGSCKVWKDKYASLIKYPEYFELEIKRIPNHDIPNLFTESHYFVMPYQDIAQSGAITVAFCYNLPTIVSDIEPFKEFVTDGITGIMFRSENEVDLADKMQYILENHHQNYRKLCDNQKAYIERELSLKSISEKYNKYLNEI